MYIIGTQSTETCVGNESNVNNINLLTRISSFWILQLFWKSKKKHFYINVYRFNFCFLNFNLVRFPGEKTYPFVEYNHS